MGSGPIGEGSGIRGLENNSRHMYRVQVCKTSKDYASKQLPCPLTDNVDIRAPVTVQGCCEDQKLPAMKGLRNAHVFIFVSLIIHQLFLLFFSCSFSVDVRRAGELERGSWSQAE